MTSYFLSYFIIVQLFRLTVVNPQLISTKKYFQKLDSFCKELCDRLELTVVEGDLRELVRERVSRLKSDKERLSAQV